MKLYGMEDVTRDITPEQRERIEVIKLQMIDAECGYELAALRKAQGMTQKDVAKVMGVTQGRVSQIERGQTRLDTSTMAACLHAIGGELTVPTTVGNVSVRLCPPARPSSAGRGREGDVAEFVGVADEVQGGDAAVGAEVGAGHGVDRAA